MIKGYSIYHLNDDVSAQSDTFILSINGFTFACCWLQLACKKQANHGRRALSFEAAPKIVL
jgi:hypothetical protein